MSVSLLAEPGSYYHKQLLDREIKLCCCFQGMKKVSEEGKIGRKLSDHKLNRRSDAEWLHLKPLSEGKKHCYSSLKCQS